MSRLISGRDALQSARSNDLKSWNRGQSSSFLSDFPSDASRRIFDSYAAVTPTYTGPKLNTATPIFAMGSCFAREIESALTRMGGNVISVDKSIHRPEFRDGDGRIRNGFFHRFTPRSMYQEFQAAFGELPGWDDNTLIFQRGEDAYIDLNYWQVKGASETASATEVRRSVAMNLVRKAAEADIIILTLGLIEAWLHKPTGFFANFTTPHFLMKRISDFDLQLIDVAETLECLEGIDSILKKHHRGNYQIVVTVSPVPLSATFTEKDIVVANMDSKSTLRAAALEFTSQHAHTHYFPSYEMVNYSMTDLAWRPDRIHVNPDMVSHIVKTFVGSYYDPDALSSPLPGINNVPEIAGLS